MVINNPAIHQRLGSMGINKFGQRISYMAIVITRYTKHMHNIIFSSFSRHRYATFTRQNHFPKIEPIIIFKTNNWNTDY